MRRTLLGFLILVACHRLHGQAPSKVSDTVPPSVIAGDANMPVVDLLHMPSPYAYEHLGFFCKAEVKVNRWLPLPVMFRLGDVQHAEELDGKGVLRGLRSNTSD